MTRCKRLALAGFGSLASLGAFASGDGGSSSAFDPTTYITNATTTVTGIATGVGTLLAAVLAIYLAYVGYRKVREALNKA